MTDLSGLRNDPQYLSTQQYKDSGNLSSRILIHQKFSTAEQSWYDFTNELMALKPDMRILEVGCGPATLWRMVLNSLHESNRIVLSDFSLGMITEAARTLSKDKRFGFVTMDTMDIAFPSESFDLVIANHMLYHVPSVLQVLDQVAGLLKPGGKFMAATNGAEHMIDLDILLEKFSKKLDQEHAMSSGFNLLNGEKQLREYFADIELHLYSSDLWVTNAKMLTEYAYSTPLVKENLGTEGKTEMSAFFQRRIDHYGGIQIRKQTGVFLARDPL
ncbi:MAG: class I SAM-dependent methyltransferase [Chloroflexi bacterium]|nr:class I SAM-dependent methyltransferase [Chloroflexota bacterium]